MKFYFFFQVTHSKNSFAGVVAFSVKFSFVTGIQLLVFHELPHDVHGSVDVNDANK